jgi:hypothetical protein
MPEITSDQAADARFQGIGRQNFSTLRFENVADLECPKLVPPWRPPRQDLLDLGKTVGRSAAEQVEEPTKAQ